jgi:hypothetical protein
MVVVVDYWKKVPAWTFWHEVRVLYDHMHVVQDMHLTFRPPPYSLNPSTPY